MSLLRKLAHIRYLVIVTKTRLLSHPYLTLNQAFQSNFSKDLGYLAVLDIITYFLFLKGKSLCAGCWQD